MLTFLNSRLDELKIINSTTAHRMKSINCTAPLDITIKDNVMFNVANLSVYINCRYNFKLSPISLNYQTIGRGSMWLIGYEKIEIT